MSKSQFNWPIVGNQPLVEYLQHCLGAGNLSHAYLWYGPEHIGKSTLTRNFIHSLYCQASGVKPCFNCEPCRQISQGIHPEVIWLSRLREEKTNKLKKNISIEQVRTLIGKLSLHSFADTYKVAVIDQAQYLSAEAANALLKTLEEPSAKTILILLTNNLAVLPPTLVSRCQLLRFRPVEAGAIEAYLLTQSADPKLARQLAALAYGRPGLAINFLAVPDSLADYQDQIQQILALPAADLVERFRLGYELLETGTDDSLAELLLELEKVWRDVLLIKFGLGALVAQPQFVGALDQLVGHYSARQILEIFRQLQQARRYARANVNQKLILENLVLNF